MGRENQHIPTGGNWDLWKPIPAGAGGNSAVDVSGTNIPTGDERGVCGELAGAGFGVFLGFWLAGGCVVKAALAGMVWSFAFL